MESKIKNETWAEIGISKGGRIRYSVSDMGRCKRENLITGQVLIDKGRRNRFTEYWHFGNIGYVHRLVAQFFVANDRPDAWLEVDHIDSNRDNNKASNLRWVDLKYNRVRRHAQKLRKIHHRNTCRKGMVLQGKRYNPSTGTYETRTWANGMECCKDLNCSHVLVYLAALNDNDPGKRSARTAKGWQLKWTKTETTSQEDA